VSLGKVTGAHGVKGILKVGTAEPDPQLFLALGEVKIGPTRHRVLEAQASRRQVLLQVSGIGSREAAEACRGLAVEAEAQRFPPLPPGEYYHFQLLGLAVVHAADGRTLGELAEIIATPAHDVYVVRDGEREVLLPAVEEVVLEIDLTTGRMTVQPPPGLLETYAD
jgi:16S rRNA processing protein RimM